MEPPQRCRLRRRRPENQRAATARPQDLLGGPQRIARLGRLDMKQALERQPDIAEPQTIGYLRRLQQRHGPLAQCAERGLQQPHLADPRLLDEQIDQRAERPAAAGQLGRQRRISRIHDARAPMRQLRSPPQRRMEIFGTNGGGKHRYPQKPVYPYSILHAIGSLGTGTFYPPLPPRRGPACATTFRKTTHFAYLPTPRHYEMPSGVRRTASIQSSEDTVIPPAGATRRRTVSDRASRMQSGAVNYSKKQR